MPRLIARLAATLFSLLAFTAAARDWPAKPVTILVPFSAGGTADIVTRILAQRLAAELGQSFLVDNRAGAGGTIATAALARSSPDGCTLLVHHMGLVFNATLYRHLPYDTLKDVAPVASIGSTPNVLVVNNDVAAKTVPEFLALARAKPRTISYGSGGVGSAGHLPMELLQSTAGIELLHVPYKGSAPAITDLIGGHIQAMLLTIPAVMPYITSGQLRAIATSGAKRSPALPQLPTLAEAGVTGFAYEPWYGVFAPAGTPGPVLREIHDAIDKVIRDPDVAEKLATQGLEVQPMPREAFVSTVRSDLPKWGAVIDKLGIKLE
jgi:tripartite-type tricarboxylate transporter receptor subunit TctC